jgi:hypothetical protein
MAVFPQLLFLQDTIQDRIFPEQSIKSAKYNPSSSAPQIFRYNHSTDSVLAGDFFYSKKFF